jgi:hypothetical protein
VSRNTRRPVEILLEIRRKLEEHGPEPAAERADVLHQELDRVHRLGLQPRVMRDALARLDREGERLGHLRRPLFQHVRLREAVEGVVDLDGRKLPA